MFPTEYSHPETQLKSLVELSWSLSALICDQELRLEFGGDSVRPIPNAAIPNDIKSVKTDLSLRLPTVQSYSLHGVP